MSRDRQRARHRPDEPASGGAADEAGLAEDLELDSYLAALAPGAGPDTTELTGRFGSAQVFQLRLPALRTEQLRRIAGDRGVSPGALVVDWVIDRLDREDTPTGPLPVLADDETPRRRGLRRLGRRWAGPEPDPPNPGRPPHESAEGAARQE